MEPFTALAIQALAFLKPHLVTAGGNFVDQALDKAGAEVKKVYGWLKSKLTRPVAATALQQATVAPTDEQNWDDLRQQLETLLKDESLRKELAALLPKDNETHKTDQKMNQVGNQNKGAQVSGNQNVVNFGQ